MTPFEAGRRAGYVLGLLWCAAMTGLLWAAAVLAIIDAFRAL